MPGRRVLVTGMGGEMGSLVASVLEEQPWVGAILGIDVDPPRLRLRRSEFRRIAPSDRARIADAVTRFDPHVLIHLAVWEPDSRAAPRVARRLTEEAAASFLGAAGECRSLESIVVRSGIEVYGRGRGAPPCPDEDAPLAPTSQYGRTLAEVEACVNDVAHRTGVAGGAVRHAPVIGAHVPSPLGRVLRQPAVPLGLFGTAPFCVLDVSDAAHAFVAAAHRLLDGPVNVVGAGSITPWQCATSSHRVPLPLVGLGWPIARRVSHVFGAPVPDQVVELLQRGLLADGSRAIELLGVTPKLSTAEVIRMLYAWESVQRTPPSRRHGLTLVGGGARAAS